MSKIRILFVDDDERLCRLVKRYVERSGYEMVYAHSAEDACELLRENTISLILLDVMLPDVDGFTLAQDILKTSSTPIIFITARNDIDDKVSGLEIGADDYITKPFEEKELIARINSVLRRTQTASGMNGNDVTHASFAGWSLNLLKQTLSSPDGDDVAITSTEYALLEKLISQPNDTIKREEILSVLSDREWSPLDRSADMAISKLRKKIEKDPRRPEIIRTIRNQGYRLTAEVEYTKA